MDKYKFRLRLIRGMLGTNPIDPHVMDTHIIDRQRKMIMEKSKVNSEVNKYLDALSISEGRGEAETNKILDRLEELLGQRFTEEQRKLAVAGKLESLRETFQELDIKGCTVFFWDKVKNLPCIGDHMIYGFMKAASEAISRTCATKRGTIFGSASYTASIINQHCRINEEFISFDTDIVRTPEGRPEYYQRSLRAMTAQGPRVSLAKSEVVPAGASLEFVLNVMEGSPLKEEHIRRIFDYGVFTGLGQWRNSGKGMFTYEYMKQQ